MTVGDTTIAVSASDATSTSSPGSPPSESGGVSGTAFAKSLIVIAAARGKGAVADGRGGKGRGN